MTKIVARNQIEELIGKVDLMSLIEQGFVAYSQGDSIVPPVGELQLERGEVHIKYGFIKQQPYYVIKIASGFYGNAELGLSTSNGCMLVFSQTTGELAGVLLDEGYLTDVRTAIAGAVSAKYLAPKRVGRIGIVGTGIQARLQLLYLSGIVDCHDVLIWGRSDDSVEKLCQRLEVDRQAGLHSFNIVRATKLSELQRTCQLIVTTTPSKEPLLSMEYIQPSTHITAVGSDMPDKQELDVRILQEADLVVADSISQCLSRGEISQALRANAIQESGVVELGQVISGAQSGRTGENQITVADLTGVAVQDIQIATAVMESLVEKNS